MEFKLTTAPGKGTQKRRGKKERTPAPHPRRAHNRALKPKAQARAHPSGAGLGIEGKEGARRSVCVDVRLLLFHMCHPRKL